VPFDYCERPPIISHGFIKGGGSPIESAYHVLSEVHYECRPGYRMKGSTDTLKCSATGCWLPNTLPECIREDLYGRLLYMFAYWYCKIFFSDASWNSDEDSSVALIATLTCLAAGCACVALFTSVCLVVVCKRKGGHSAQPSGPAHWSTTVTVTPECRPRAANGNQSRDPRVASPTSTSSPPPPQTILSENGRAEHDRMALIAFADGVQVTLPSYEEALRESNGDAGVPARMAHYSESLVNGNGALTHANGMNHGYRYVQNGGDGDARNGQQRRNHVNGVANRRTRHPAGNGHAGRYVQQSTYPAGALDQRQTNGHINGGMRRVRGGRGGGSSGQQPDALSDSASHHSVQIWQQQQQQQPVAVACNGGGRHRRGDSTSGSSSGGSGHNVNGSVCNGSANTASTMAGQHGSQSTSLRSSNSSSNDSNDAAALAAVAASGGNPNNGELLSPPGRNGHVVGAVSPAESAPLLEDASNEPTLNGGSSSSSVSSDSGSEASEATARN